MSKFVVLLADGNSTFVELGPQGAVEVEAVDAEQAFRMATGFPLPVKVQQWSNRVGGVWHINHGDPKVVHYGRHPAWFRIIIVER